MENLFFEFSESHQPSQMKYIQALKFKISAAESDKTSLM